MLEPGDYAGSVIATWSNGIQAEPFEFLIKSADRELRQLS